MVSLAIDGLDGAQAVTKQYDPADSTFRQEIAPGRNVLAAFVYHFRRSPKSPSTSGGRGGEQPIVSSRVGPQYGNAGIQQRITAMVVDSRCGSDGCAGAVS